MENKIVLMDGNSILNRAFYAIPELTTSKGIPTNAVYGFLNMLFRFLQEEQPTYLCVAFDVKAPTFRHQLYDAYKGTRKPMPESLKQQMALLKDVLQVMQVAIIEKAGYEADDLLGTLSRRAVKEGLSVCIVSGDRDLLQLASDQIMIRIPKTKAGKTEVENYHATEVFEKYEVSPSQIIELKALMGDASDNIPGVPGIGEKTAIKIIKAFGSIENAYAHRAEIMPKKARENLEQYYDLATLSKTLATIQTDCEIAFSLEQSKCPDFTQNEAVFQLFKQLEFHQLIDRFSMASTNQTTLEENFQIITTKEDCETCFLQAKNQEKIGIQWVGQQKEPVGCAVAIQEQVYFFVISETLPFAVLLEQMQQLQQKNMIFALFDWKSQYSYWNTIPIHQIFDLTLAAYLCNPLKSTYSYDGLAKEFCDLLLPSKAELDQRQQDSDTIAMQQACYQAYVANLLYEKMKQTLKTESLWELFCEMELPLVPILVKMEEVGVRVEKQALIQFGTLLGTKMEQLEQKIYAFVGETFNLNSPKQLGVILFEKLKLPFAKKTKTGYSTSADLLEKLKGMSPVIEWILEYRQVAKLKSTYADGLLPLIDTSDGRIHSTFHQTVTATGRLSNSEPNLQNIPIRTALGREMRKVFLPAPSYVFLDADYSQIELRILAHLSQDETLLQAYREKQDIHQLTASQVFHVPPKEVTKEQRRDAKVINFGILYGMSAFRLGQDLGISRAEAQCYMEAYFAMYPKVKSYLDGLIAQGKETGFVTSLYQRKRPLPELSSSHFMQRAFGERAAMNFPMQATAADIIKRAMILVEEQLQQQQLQSRIVLQIHDELLVETKETEVEKVKAILLEQMPKAANLLVPLEVEVKQGENWYVAH